MLHEWRDGDGGGQHTRGQHGLCSGLDFYRAPRVALVKYRMTTRLSARLMVTPVLPEMAVGVPTEVTAEALADVLVPITFRK